jgi:hypothetical protein
MKNENTSDIDFNELIKDYRVTNLDNFTLYLQDVFKVLITI